MTGPLAWSGRAATDVAIHIRDRVFEVRGGDGVDFFDSMNQHVGHTVDFGQGHGATYDAMGHFQHGWQDHSDGMGATITNAFGVTTSVIQETATGIDVRDSMGNLLQHAYEFGGKTHVQDAMGRHLSTIDPTAGTMTSSLGLLQMRFR